jgi:hypothetical protein
MSFELLSPSLGKQISQFLNARDDTGAITLVFANSAYEQVLDNWLRYAGRFVNSNLLIFALDVPLYDVISARGLPVILLPYDGTNEALWLERLKVFQFFCSMGIDFVHSDADAIWLREPLSYCFSIDADLVISQGTIWPPDVAENWGFVLCCGFFAVRASDKMASFFTNVMKVATEVLDDQVALNRTLRAAGISWTSDGLARDEMTVNGLSFHCFNDVVFGKAPSLGLRVAMLPHDDFQRLPRHCSTAYVKHLLTPKDAILKIATLREHGCWFD